MSDTMNGTHETLVGTCAVCERGIAVDENTKLVHHGFKRPGDGRIHGDCFGVGYLPYERSTDCCFAYQTAVRHQKAQLLLGLDYLDSGKKMVFRNPFGVRGQGRVYVIGVTEPTRMQRIFDSDRAEILLDIKRTDREIDRMQRMIDGWQLVELGTETRADKAEREALEARKAERATKAAEKVAKKARLTAERAAKVAATLEFAAGWSTMLASCSTRDAAETMLEDMEKAARKAKLKYRAWSTGPDAEYATKEFGLRNLLSRERIVELGLGYLGNGGFLFFH